MKYFVCVLFLFPAITYSQPNGTSSIKISGIGLQQVIRGFLDAGYPIERSGQNLKTIVSGPKKSPSNNITTVLTVNINGRDIVISGEYSTEEHKYTIVKVTGEKTGPAWDSWKEMFDFAGSFKKPVEFIVK